MSDLLWNRHAFPHERYKSKYTRLQSKYVHKHKHTHSLVTDTIDRKSCEHGSRPLSWRTDREAVTAAESKRVRAESKRRSYSGGCSPKISGSEDSTAAASSEFHFRPSGLSSIGLGRRESDVRVVVTRTFSLNTGELNSAHTGHGGFAGYACGAAVAHTHVPPPPLLYGCYLGGKKTRLLPSRGLVQRDACFSRRGGRLYQRVPVRLPWSSSTHYT